MLDAVVAEGVAVEAGQAVVGGEPQEAARVADDPVDAVVCETVGRRVGVVPWGEVMGR